MNKNKSKSAYTNIWLRRNKHLWYEKRYNGGNCIFFKTKCPPKIVVERVNEINEKRRNTVIPGIAERLVNALIGRANQLKANKRA